MGRKVKTKGFPKKFGIKLSKVINKSGWYISLILKHIIPTTFDNFRLWISNNHLQGDRNSQGSERPLEHTPANERQHQEHLA